MHRRSEPIAEVDERNLESALSSQHRVAFASSDAFAELLQREVRRLEIHAERGVELAEQITRGRAVLRDRTGRRESHTAEDPPVISSGEFSQGSSLLMSRRLLSGSIFSMRQ